MKQKVKATPKTVYAHPSEKQTKHALHNTRQLLGCGSRHGSEQTCGSSAFAPSSSSTSSSASLDRVDGDSLKVDIYQNSSDIINREVEIHYGKVVGALAAGPSAFFSPSRRKQSNFFRPLGQGDAVPVSYANVVAEGAEQAHGGHDSEGAPSDVQRFRKRGRPRNACASAHGNTEIASSHGTLGANQAHDAHGSEGASSDAQRFRKRGRTRKACASVHGDTEIPVCHAALGIPPPFLLFCASAFYMSREFKNSTFAYHIPGVVAARKRPADGHLPSAPCDHDRSQTIAESISCVGEAASPHGQQSRKRVRPQGASATVHGIRGMAVSHGSEGTTRSRKKAARPHQPFAACDRNCSQALTESINDAGEGPSSHAQQPRKRSRSQNPSASVHVVPGMPHSHGNQTPRQPRKRGRRTHQPPAAEGSTSHAPDNAGPAYDDLDFPPLDPQIVQDLIHFLDSHNELVQIFRTARDKCAEADVPEFRIRLYSGDSPRGYELPSSNTLGAIVFDRGPESESNCDVIVEYRDGPLKRISKIHKSYMSLQFPLIFIYGQPGYHTKLMLRIANPDDEPKRLFQIHALILHGCKHTGTPPETLDFIKPKPLKTIADQETPQGGSTKTAKRALFQSQPTESKKQKGTFHIFI
ncbi:hypothetical protein CTI12_AA356090 [Artemisia annua]|uniref:Helitron helicase-like domain-containing protein n=1 Tax=Artemisia annua TaxID=35608 RepID=A0A2U1M1F0_ARTAN|nr:hypothetical protein CTI12_AA356090 [Artemisia annua]